VNSDRHKIIMFVGARYKQVRIGSYITVHLATRHWCAKPETSYMRYTSRPITKKSNHMLGHIPAALYEGVRVPVVHSLALPSFPSCPPELAGRPNSRRLLRLSMSSTSSGSVHPLLPPGKAHLIPVEILSEIFLLVLLDRPLDKATLEVVCQRWHAIILLIPGITSRLWIRRATKKEAVQAFIQRRKTRFAVIVDVNDEEDGKDFNADEFHASFIVACQAAPRWQFLNLQSFPPPGEYKAPDTTVKPLESLRGFVMREHCDLGSFLEPLMTAITTTTLPRLTKLVLSDPRAVLYLVQPTCLHRFFSLTTLTIKLSKKMESPADILPHLRRLESFHAQHLHLPIYPLDASFPLIQTLTSLVLKSVSVQWMAGKVFPALQRCSIRFPHHIDAIRVEPVDMPSCISLTYDSNDLDPLRHFHHPPLTELEVTSGQWNVRRGNLQFVAMCPTVFSSAQSLSELDLGVQCSERLLVLALRLLPALEALCLRLASPHALSETFFQGFVAAKSNAGSPCEIPSLPRQPLGANLIELEVHYRRWLRGPERKGLIPVFSDIVSSRQGCTLSLGIGGPAQYWFIQGPVGSTCDVADDNDISTIGISSPYGIIPLETRFSVTEVPFKEAEYLVARHRLSIGCLSTLHNLVELRVGDKQDILPTAPPPNLPLFRTLRVFTAENIHPSFLAGQTFHRLERGRIFLHGEGPNLNHAQVTQLPVCTRLDVDDLTLLATFQIPQVSELGVFLDHPEFGMIWERRITVNANLSGLTLLHVYGWRQQADLIQALRCLPALKSFIVVSGSDLDADFFGAFVPMLPNETAALMQSHNEGRGFAILCPMLKSLLIEEYDLTQRLELIPVFRQVVTLRAVSGSPLERFTFFDYELGRKTELVGGHGIFVMETIVLDGDAEPFSLDI